MQDGRLAKDFARRALDQDPDHGFALSTEAFVCAHMDADLSKGHEGCIHGLELAPQDPQCWRMLSGRGGAAQGAARELIARWPTFTVGAFERRYPGRNEPHAPAYFAALHGAGIPQ